MSRSFGNVSIGGTYSGDLEGKSYESLKCYRSCCVLGFIAMMVSESLVEQEQAELDGQSMDGVSNDDFHPNFASCSVEQLLSIPIQYIFQKTQSGKYIFSKSEVSTLLRVSMLASELDAILSLAYDALDRSHKCKTYQKYIEVANKHPKSSNDYIRGVSLRALLPVLSIHLETADDAIKHATSDSFGVTRILGELQSLSADLEKFSAMNYTRKSAFVLFVNVNSCF